jgi:hypothetical protein
VAAYHFARRKLKWIDEATDLTAVVMPRSKGRLPSYTLAEVRKILPKLEAVCDEAGWMGHAAFQSGRRSNALRHIEKADVRCFRDHSVVTFSDDHDKAGRTGQVVLVGRAHELTVRLMKRPGRYILGTTVPDETRCIRSWLRPAEAAAGVKHVKGRGWHAFKKRFATEARTVAGFEMQAGTRRDTLEAHYVQDDLDAKRAVAEKLNAALSVSAEE